MSSNRKPRKPYRPKLALLPLGIRRTADFEIPALTALAALGQPYFEAQHVYNMPSSSDLAKRIAPEGHPIVDHAQAIIFAIADIQERAEQLGKTGATGDEMRILRENVPAIIKFLRTVSNFELASASIAAHNEFSRTGVLWV